MIGINGTLNENVFRLFIANARDPDTTDSEPRTTINGFSLIIGTKVKTRTATDREEFLGNEPHGQKVIFDRSKSDVIWETALRFKLAWRLIKFRKFGSIPTIRSSFSVILINFLQFFLKKQHFLGSIPIAEKKIPKRLRRRLRSQAVDIVIIHGVSVGLPDSRKAICTESCNKSCRSSCGIRFIARSVTIYNRLIVTNWRLKSAGLVCMEWFSAAFASNGNSRRCVDYRLAGVFLYPTRKKKYRFVMTAKSNRWETRRREQKHVRNHKFLKNSRDFCFRSGFLRDIHQTRQTPNWMIMRKKLDVLTPTHSFPCRVRHVQSLFLRGSDGGELN